jgi:hypothetical protein
VKFPQIRRASDQRSGHVWLYVGRCAAASITTPMGAIEPPRESWRLKCVTLRPVLAAAVLRNTLARSL